MRGSKRGCLLKIFLCSLFLLYAVFLPPWARADYPERPITVIVGMDPGGPVDTCARALMSGAQKYLNKPIVIENRGGATVL